MQAFEPDSMMPKRRVEFEKWYPSEWEKFADKSYNGWSELVNYCRSDTSILRKACLAFSAAYEEHTRGIQPFTDGSTTLTSANFRAFRRNFLKENTVAIINDTGLPNARYSSMACAWLEWMSEQNCISIKHAGNSREVRVCGYPVDGYSEDVPSMTHRGWRWVPGKPCIYQFYGCLYHACPACYKDRQLRFMGETMEHRYVRTVRVETRLRKRDYNVVTMWEHQYAEQCKYTPDLLQLAKRFGAIKPHLRPRDGYYGGRVECFAHIKTMDTLKREKGYYFDFCGLCKLSILIKVTA